MINTFGDQGKAQRFSGLRPPPGNMPLKTVLGTTDIINGKRGKVQKKKLRDHGNMRPTPPPFPPSLLPLENHHHHHHHLYLNTVKIHQA